MLNEVAEAEQSLAGIEAALERTQTEEASLQAAVAPLWEKAKAFEARIHALATRPEFQKSGVIGWLSPGPTEAALAEYASILASCQTLVSTAAQITGHPHTMREKLWQGIIYRMNHSLLDMAYPEVGEATVRTRLSDTCRSLTAQRKAARQRLRQARSELKLFQKESTKAGELARLKAKAASLDRTSRELADNIKHQLRSQTDCPYCGGGLGEQPHADHIYPVAKGGHSVLENMVMVCAACNIRKGVLTLRAFITKYSLDRGAIEQRLLALKKDF